jgi:hypothetical protein
MQSWFNKLLPALALACTGSAEAATYYVRNGGSDTADGRSHSTAWATLGRVNSFNFATGDVVLLHEGHRFVGQVTVDWAGTASARAVLGAYYLDGSTAVRGYRSARPIVDGEDRIPTGHYAGLVRAVTAFSRIENLRVEDSEGRGIDVLNANDAEIVGNAIYNTYGSSVHVQRSSRSRVESNFATGAGIGWRQDGGPWGASLESVQSNYVIFRDNVVSEVYGEGINTHSGSQYTLIERNSLFGARAVGIYSDGAPDTTIRRNLVIGTANNTFWRGSNSVGAGIALNNERYHYPAGGGSQSTSVQTKRARIYENLVAYTSAGIALWGELAESSFDGTLIYNNTLVDNNTQVAMQGKPKPGSKFINNILLSLSGGARDIDVNTLGGVVARNNYFSQGNPGGDYTHPGNRFTGLSLAKMSGWRAVTSRDQVTWRDFVLARGSAGIGAGDDEPRRTTDATHNYVLDHNAAAHSAPMDMGGLTFATPVGAGPPMAPGALSGT